MGFQTSVNQYNPLAVAGDFASANPRATVLASEGGLVAGPNGVLVGQFAWVEPSTTSDSDGTTVTNFAQGAVAPAGFVHRDQQALIEAYLQQASMLIPEGFPVILHNAGDFFAVANGEAATVGASVYARYSDGAIFIGAAPTGASVTGSIGATFTASAGSPATELVVTSVTGLISIGDVVSGTGITAGTTILSQISGTPGGAGTYGLSAANTTSAATVTSFGTVLDVTAVSSGSLAPGDAISGTGIPTGSTIESQVSGSTGGVGVYTINTPASAYAASTTVTVVAGIVTAWKAASVAAVGELVKISSWGVQ